MARLTRVITGGYVTGFRPDKTTAPAITLPFTETWDTGGDAAGTLDGDFLWNDFIGTSQWQRASDRARLFGATSVAQGGYLNQDCGTDDVAVTLTYPVYTVGTNTLSAGPMVRMPGTANFTGYCAAVVSTGGTQTLILFRFLAGVQAQIGAVPVTSHANMTVGVSAYGNRIRALFDGLVRIDTASIPGFVDAIPSGRFVGLQGFNNGTGDVAVDNLAATNSAPHRVPVTELLGLSPFVGVH